MKAERIEGAVLALALGDAFGAPHEGGTLERAVWALIGKRNGKHRWTDDTVMTLDLIESLIVNRRVDQDDLASRFAASYHWSRGYGPGAAKVLKRIRRGQSWEEANCAVYPEGSFGNGGAMRAPVIGLFFADDNEDGIASAASRSAAVTHAHPEGREGAVLIALATAFAYNDMNSHEILSRLTQRTGFPLLSSRLRTASTWVHADTRVQPRKVAAELGNGITAVDSVVTAIYLALRFRNGTFNELLEFTIKLRGDVDTIAAMAAAIWGAARGKDALPENYLHQLERFDRLQAVARRFADAAGHHTPGISG